MIIPQQGRKFEFSWKVREPANRAKWPTELMPILSGARFNFRNFPNASIYNICKLLSVVICVRLSLVFANLFVLISEEQQKAQRVIKYT